MECEKTKEACTAMKEQGAYIFVISGGSRFQTIGMPDRYITHPLFSGWIEFKDQSTELRTDQKLVIQKLNAYHTMCYIVRFVYGGFLIENHKRVVLAHGTFYDTLLQKLGELQNGGCI